MTIASRSLRYRKGKITVAVKCVSAAPCRGTVRLLAGRAALGARKYRLKSGAKSNLAVKLTARGRMMLFRAKGKKITVTLVPAGGRAVTKKLAVEGLVGSS